MDLIKAGALAFDDKDVLDVNRNLLPDHQRPKINTIGNDPELQIEKDVKAVCMPKEIVYKALLKAGTLNEEQEKKKEKEDGKGKGKGKGSIVNTTRSLWAIPFKIVKIF